MAIHSSILAWKIPRTEEPGRLQSMGLQRVRHDWAQTHTHTTYPTSYFLYRSKSPWGPAGDHLYTELKPSLQELFKLASLKTVYSALPWLPVETPIKVLAERPSFSCFLPSDHPETSPCGPCDLVCLLFLGPVNIIHFCFPRPPLRLLLWPHLTDRHIKERRTICILTVSVNIW